MNISLTCQHCGATYARRADRAAKSRFCSAKCQQEASVTLLDLNCATCGQSFKRKPSQVAKTKQHFCSKACYDAAQVNRVEIICQQCKKPFSVYPNQATKRKLCSIECRALWKTRGEERPCECCGKTFWVYPFRKQEARFCSRACYLKTCGESESEKSVRLVLEDLNVEYVQQHPFGIYTADFYLPILSTVLEVDGHGWHQPHQERDAKRDATLQEQGIATVRINTRELRKFDVAHLVKTKLGI